MSKNTPCLFYCTNPPAILSVRVNGKTENYKFLDNKPVEVSKAASIILDMDDTDDFERVLDGNSS